MVPWLVRFGVRFLAIGFAVFTMTASAVCGDELRIDGSSKENFERSVAKIFESLTPKDRELFIAGMTGYIISNSVNAWSMPVLIKLWARQATLLIRLQAGSVAPTRTSMD